MAQINSRKPSGRPRRDMAEGVMSQQYGIHFVYIGGRPALRLQLNAFDDRIWHVDFNEGETAKLTDRLIAERMKVEGR